MAAPLPLDLDECADASELVLAERPALVRGTLWHALLFLAAAVAWSCVTQIDIVVTAPGIVRPSGDIVPVQALRSGVVAELLVLEGAAVDSGTLLLRLDSRALELECENILARIAGRRALAAETLKERENDLAQARLDLDAARERVALVTSQSRARLATAAARRDAAAVSLSLQETRVAKTRELVAAGIARALDLDAEKASLAALRSNLALAERELEEARAASVPDLSVVRLAEGRIALKRAAVDVVAALTPRRGVARVPAIEAEIAALEQDLAAIEIRIARSEVRAPTAGTITRLARWHDGQLVSEGSLVAELLPRGSRLVLEATVKNSDRRHSLVRKKAHLRFAAFRRDEYGAVEGEVRSVSLDALGSDGSPAPGLGYKATIDLPHELEMRGRHGERGRIELGMLAEADVVVERTPAILCVLGELRDLFEARASD